MLAVAVRFVVCVATVFVLYFCLLFCGGVMADEDEGGL